MSGVLAGLVRSDVEEYGHRGGCKTVATSKMERFVIIVNGLDVAAVLDPLLGQYLDFQVTKPWVRSLYHRMEMSRRVSTTSRPIITPALWEEISAQYSHEISSLTKSHEIPDELILKLDQTSSKFVAASKVTAVEQGSKHVSIAGGTDKRCITLTVTENMSGQLLYYKISTKEKRKGAFLQKLEMAKNLFFLAVKNIGVTTKRLCL